jgi:hypothetical protein
MGHRHGAGARVGCLARVDGAGRETELGRIAFHWGILSNGISWVDFIAARDWYQPR